MSASRIGYYPALDGLRGVAVLLVMASHTDRMVRSGEPALLSGGVLGVDIFFVLSGFLITAMLLGEWQETERINIPLFYARRALRLLPALCFMLVTVLIYGVATSYGPQARLWLESLFALFYLSNVVMMADGVRFLLVGHSWSLSVEEHFYLLWPLALTLLLRLQTSPRFRLLIVALLTVAFSVERWLLVSTGLEYWQVIFRSDARADALLAGCAAALALSLRLPQHVRKLAMALRLGSVLSIVSIAYLVVTVSVADLWLYQGGYTLVAILAAVLVSQLVSFPEAFPSNVLRLRWLVAIGRISYGLYLWHYPVFLIVGRSELGLPAPIVMSVGFAIALGAASASRLWIERPALELKARLRPGRLASAAMRPST